MESLLTTDALVSLLTLTAMEIVLGIDNIVFLSILVGKLPESQRNKTRQIGLALALGMRVLLLLSIKWVMGLTEPLFSLLSHSFSGRDLILLGGGIFLIGKSTHEIYEKLEVHTEQERSEGGTAKFGAILIQIIILDLVFSLDSVITAVGMADQVSIMIIAMIVAVVVMLVFARPIGDFVERHPSMKILALSFLILIGVMLTAEGFGQHVGKGYIYGAMAFSLLVELANMRFRKNHRPVKLHQRFEED